MDNGEKEWNGGKFPNRGRKGLALSEFIDDAEVNRTTDDEWESERDLAPAPRRTAAQSFGRAVGTIVANPTLVIATVAAIPLLLIVWGVGRSQKKKSDSPKPPLPPHPL
ncbi:MAG TPA: hypothetical protein VNM92_08590 [Thermoanaerobaculia bacterium]|nr:hypothetical protein [Thermoanaerobaculia bacterium]